MIEERQVLVTENLRRWLDELPADYRIKASNFIGNGLEHYIDEYSRTRKGNVLGTISGILALLDELFEHAANPHKHEIKCRRGCSFCCHINVDICEDEAKLLLHGAKENGIEIDWEHVRAQAEIKNTLQQALSPHSACTFLRGTECSVYEYRPIACRKYFVISDPSLCDASKNVGKTMIFFDLQSEILASAIANTGQKTAPMATMLLKSKMKLF